MRTRQAVLECAVERIVGHVKKHHKIIESKSLGLLIDELLPVTNRIGSFRGCRRRLILDAIDLAVKQDRLGRFQDEYGVIIALPNEWPPAFLQAFPTIGDDDFEPLYAPDVFRHVRGVSPALLELSNH